MEQIDISINKAIIKSYTVTLRDDGLPDVYVTIGLFAAGGKEITTFSMNTASYAEIPFKVPPDMIAPIVSIAKQLEIIVTQECNKSLNLIEAPKETIL